MAGLAVVAAAGLSLALYLATMPPTITWWFGGSDSGDLASAADLLGIPHPTGYPLFVILGHLSSRIPAGEVAGRINVMNGTLAALGAGLAGATVLLLSPDRERRSAVRLGATICAMLALATSGLYWSQAIIGEVYALHAALTALVLWIWARPHTHPMLRGAAHGLALTNHLTSVLFLVAAALAVWTARRGAWSGAAMGWFGVGVLAPLALYALLPLRAAHHPAANWGDPSTPARFVAHVTGRQYAGLIAWGEPVTAAGDLLRLLRLMAGDLPPWVLPAAAVGARALWRTQRRFVVLSALIAVGVLVFSAMYQTADRAPYLLPAFVVVCVWAGVGLEVAARWIVTRLGDGRRRLYLPAGATAVVIVLAVWGTRAGMQVNLHGDDSALVFARTTLVAMPVGGTYYSARDDVTFALRYAQRSLGVRPDVRVIDVRGAGEQSRP